MNTEEDIESLRRWFLQEKREFPWRESPTPYAVWISEIMLQQTRADVVVPYFLRWMDAFPTIHSLASASIETVIKLWEGLGYYSRARNIHAAAQYLVIHHEGKIPQEEEKLKAIKGIGPYTIGAIRSFAFHQKAAAVDGNVLRVLARYFSIFDCISKTTTQKRIRQLAHDLLPDQKPWEIAEALIELGATICTPKKTNCLQCPLRRGCRAFGEGEVQNLPVKKKKQVITPLFRAVGVISCKGHICIGKVRSKVMQDLWEFPYWEVSEEVIKDPAFVEKTRLQLEGQLQVKLEKQRELPEQQHGFTRYRVRLRPIFFETREECVLSDYEWVSKKELLQYPFSSGHRRVLHSFLQTQANSGES